MKEEKIHGRYSQALLRCRCTAPSSYFSVTRWVTKRKLVLTSTLRQLDSYFSPAAVWGKKKRHNPVNYLFCYFNYSELFLSKPLAKTNKTETKCIKSNTFCHFISVRPPVRPDLGVQLPFLHLRGVELRVSPVGGGQHQVMPGCDWLIITQCWPHIGYLARAQGLCRRGQELITTRGGPV